MLNFVLNIRNNGLKNFSKNIRYISFSIRKLCVFNRYFMAIFVFIPTVYEHEYIVLVYRSKYMFNICIPRNRYNNIFFSFLYINITRNFTNSNCPIPTVFYVLLLFICNRSKLEQSNVIRPYKNIRGQIASQKSYRYLCIFQQYFNAYDCLYLFVFRHITLLKISPIFQLSISKCFPNRLDPIVVIVLLLLYGNRSLKNTIYNRVDIHGVGEWTVQFSQIFCSPGDQNLICDFFPTQTDKCFTQRFCR